MNPLIAIRVILAFIMTLSASVIYADGGEGEPKYVSITAENQAEYQFCMQIRDSQQEKTVSLIYTLAETLGDDRFMGLTVNYNESGSTLFGADIVSWVADGRRHAYLVANGPKLHNLAIVVKYGQKGQSASRINTILSIKSIADYLSGFATEADFMNACKLAT